MKIIYIPLDERPCNYHYPLRAVRTIDDIEVIAPSVELLGYKKKAADTKKLWDFIEKNVKSDDILIISTEMLMYGGLVPSRLHHKNDDEREFFISKIRQLKNEHPNLQIYLSNLIMRTPQYNSSDEEPDYYETFGLDIFKLGLFIDKSERGIITDEETKEYEKISKSVPKEIIADFKDRREYNKTLTLSLLNLVDEGIISLMVIPQDDSHEFGFTAIDQNEIYPKIRDLKLSEKVLVYPGADEVGYELLARSVNKIRNQTPKIYVHYSSVNGPFIIPTYEDREIGESLKSHVLVSGGRLVNTPNESDFILSYNTPGQKMIESSLQKSHRLISFDRNRNLTYFVNEIKLFVKDYKKVVICDASFSNGGDLQLLEMLASEKGILENICAYRGWNTNCNSLGTALAEGIFSLHSSEELRRNNNIACMIDDVFYQAIIRGNIAEKELEPRYLTYFDLKDKQKEIIEILREQINQCMLEYIKNDYQDFDMERLTVNFPWNRMFEIYCNYE